MKPPSLLFCFLVLTFLVVPLTFAEDNSFQFNQDFDLKRACSDRGFFCDSSFRCNISIMYPNGNIMVDNQRMTLNSSFRNITIARALNNQLGIHKAIMSCNNVTDAGQDTFDIIITGDGNDFQQFPTQVVYIFIAIALVIVGSLSEKLRLVKYMGSIFGMIMGVLTLYPGYSFINYSTLLGKGLGFSMIGLGFFFLIEDSFSHTEQVETYNHLNDGRFHDND